MKRRPYFRSIPCSYPGCKEVARYQHDTLREYQESYRRDPHKIFTCCRHNATTVLSVTSLRSEWISEPSKPLDRINRYTGLPSVDDGYRSWGSHGVLIGPGYYAEGKDFPTGTRIRITAEVFLPVTEVGA